jgi:hypothetical protein
MRAFLAAFDLNPLYVRYAPSSSKNAGAKYKHAPQLSTAWKNPSSHLAGKNK